MDKEQFLKEFGKDYGYPQGPKTIDEIRSMEFKRLEGSVYLDHAGATLYSELQMEAIFRDLTSSVYGNPHSQSDSSVATSEIVQECRQQVLDYCNASAKDYRCIFTSGATAALKMVGETFPWSCHSSFMHTTENHNSVIGMREYALSKGAAASAVDIEEHVDHGALHIDGESSFKLLKRSILRRSSATFMEEDCKGNAYHLFAFPSECNFSGQKFNLELVNIIKKYPEEIFEGSAFSRGHWLVLIDAAKGCATEPPDLSKYQADFVVVSFYKLFGYPTGLGALVVRNEAAKLLKKTYFSGGTVAASIADVDFVRPRDGIEQWLEDGTTSFLNIVSLRHGFKILNALTFAAISRSLSQRSTTCVVLQNQDGKRFLCIVCRGIFLLDCPADGNMHVTSLATYLRRALLSLKHENGADVCVLYGEDISKGHRKMGPVVSFNLKRPDNSWFGYREVEKLASLSGIQLRTGCFCNPGACAKFLGLSQLELLSNVEAGHVCWDDYDIVNGKPTGAIRVSFGYMSMFEEAKKFVDFVVNSFVSLPSPIHPRNCNRLSIEGRDKRYSAGCSYLKSVTVYPIKSCGGFCVDSWPMSKTGLLHDREWLLETPSGEILTQKKVPEMGLINTFIDLGRGILFVESPRCRTKLQIILELGLSSAEREQMLLHGQRYEVLSYNDEVNSWFSNAVARPCMLFRCLSSDDISKRKEDQRTCRDVKTMLNFVNEAQLLLISEASVSDLNSRLHSKAIKGSQIPLQVSAMRFRPNLVISGGEPYAEDEWTKVQIGDKLFASLGGCNRCQMINFDHHSGQVQKTNEPLATLATYRRAKGRISFGVLLRYENHKVTGDGEESWLQVGQEVHPLVRQLRESL